MAEPVDGDLAVDEDLPEAPGRPRLRGGLPRLPVSPPPEPQTPPAPSTAGGPPGPASQPGPATPSPQDRPQSPPGPAPTGPGRDSSPASTTNPDPPPKPRQVELADPEDLRKALVQAADMAFVVGGQVIGKAYEARNHEPRDTNRWVPTVEERELVLEPAARIIKRHVEPEVEALDAIDAALIAAGVGHFAVRTMFGVEALPDKAKEQTRA